MEKKLDELALLKLFYKMSGRGDKLTYCNAMVRGSKVHSVSYEDGKWTCTCEHFLYTKKMCKHIDYVKKELFLRTLCEV